MLKNNVPAPSCIPPAGLEVLTRRYPIVPIEKNTRPAGLEVLKGHKLSRGGPISPEARIAGLKLAFEVNPAIVRLQRQEDLYASAGCGFQ